MNHHLDIGVIFDMDGVLVDSADAHLQSWQRLARELDRHVTPEDFARTFGRQNRDIIPLVFGKSTDERIVALADRKEAIYRDLVRAKPPIMPGAVDLIRDLAGAQARLAVGSSAPRANIDLMLTAMGVTKLISAVVSGDDVTRGKPHPGVFLFAAEHLDLDPSRCVVIEDAPVGVQAAKRAGMKCIAVTTHHDRHALSEADAVGDHVRSLTAQWILSVARSG